MFISFNVDFGMGVGGFVVYCCFWFGLVWVVLVSMVCVEIGIGMG